MKSTYHLLRVSALAAASLFLAATSASAQTILLSDVFEEDNQIRDNFNANLGTTQTGTLAPMTYTLADGPQSWAAQHGHGGRMLLAGYNAPTSQSVYASLNHNFAADANSLNAPLEIKFNIEVSVTADNSNWATIALGASQNLFVNDGANKFSSLFRDNGETQQFASGTLAGNTMTFTDGDQITLLLSDTDGTGSAFNGNGSVAKIYINSELKGTFTDLGLGASDGYISFQAFQAQGFYDNLVVTALTTSPAPDYDTWANSFDPAIGLATADDDNDGLTNFHEYAFGLTPNSGASVNPISVQLDKSTGNFSYTRRATSGLDYSVWYSTDLSTWNEDTTATEGTPVLVGDVETVPVAISGSLLANPKLFIQVRAN